MPPAPEARAVGARQAAAWGVLVAGVTLAHLWLAGHLVPARLGEGSERAPERMAVAFVTELKPAAPPAAPPERALARIPARPLLSSAALPAASAASAASAPALETALEPLMPVPPEVMPPEVLATAPAEASSQAVAEPASSPAAAPAFEWPPSTRLSYRLTGDFRGPVEGQAQVEWLRDGLRYQVHLDVGVGPAFAPLLSRSTRSEGRITPDGLHPERFDETTRVLLREPRRLGIDMAGPLVRLAQGSEVPRPDGLQDSASQFVQLTWLFTNRPELLRAGQTLPMPLALPRRVQLWQYEVGETVEVDTPVGPVQAVHVRPRPDVASDARRGGDLVPEAWFAPSLQYLPVRILIRQEGGQEGGNFVDLRIERLPQQAAPGR